MAANDRFSDEELGMILGDRPVPDDLQPERHSALRNLVLQAYDDAGALPVGAGSRRFIGRAVAFLSHPVTRVATALAVVLALVIWLAPKGASIVFADVIVPVVEAKSAKFKVVARIDAQREEVSATAYFLAPNRYRQEFANRMVSIADFDCGRMLSLMPEEKEAIIFELENVPADNKAQNNLFGDLRALLAEHRETGSAAVEELGEKELEGRRAIGFKLKATGVSHTLWADAETGELIRVEARYSGPPKSEVVMSDFEFDVPLDASLFDTEPPEGYTLTSIPIDASRPTEQDFIASLRQLSDAVEGKFPDSLDTPGIAVALGKFLKGKEQQEQMTAAAALARGLQFAMTLPPDSDAHYAGQDVGRQGPQRPIFWYRPARAETYRVIWSDLTVSETETAPDLPTARRLAEE